MIKRVRNLIIPLLCATVLGACAATHPADKTPTAAVAPAGSGSSNLTTLTVSAEAALKRGDCREASETYAKAAAIGSTSAVTWPSVSIQG